MAVIQTLSCLSFRCEFFAFRKSVLFLPSFPDVFFLPCYFPHLHHMLEATQVILHSTLVTLCRILGVTLKWHLAQIWMAPSLVWRTPCQEAITRNQLTAVAIQAKWVGHNVQNNVMCLIFADSNFLTSWFVLLLSNTLLNFVNGKHYKRMVLFTILLLVHY